jgi:hypothetical protein
MSLFDESGLYNRAAELAPPIIADFNALKETLLIVAARPGAVVHGGPNKLGFTLERPFMRDHYHKFSFVVRFSGIITEHSGDWAKLNISYQESIANPVPGSGFRHDYRLEQRGGEVVDSGQSIQSAAPTVEGPPVADNAAGMVEYLQAEAGLAILQEHFGKPVPLTAGDCGVLYDRMQFVAQ